MHDVTRVVADHSGVDASQQLLSSEEIRLLSALGFMAARCGQLVPCLRIFEALAILRPATAFPFIGMAIGYLAVGMPQPALQVLEGRASPTASDDPELMLYRSLALKHAGRSSESAAALHAWESASGQRAHDHPLARTLLADTQAAERWLDWPVPASVSEPVS